MALDQNKGVWKSAKGKGRRTPKGRQFEDKAMSEVQALLVNRPRQKGLLIEFLHLIQDKYGYLSAQHLCALAEELKISMAEVYEVASFYSMFNLEPIGKNFIQICTTTSCWLKGSDDILKLCKKHLRIENNQTTKDGLFTLKEVECLGACVNAPMMQINDNYYEDLDKEKTLKILESLLKGETPKPGSYRGRRNNEPENNRKTLLDLKNA